MPGPATPACRDAGQSLTRILNDFECRTSRSGLRHLPHRQRRPGSAVVTRLCRKSGGYRRLGRNVGVALRVDPAFGRRWRRRGRKRRIVCCRLRRGALWPWRNRLSPVLHGGLGVSLLALCGRCDLSAQLLLAGFQILDRAFQRSNLACVLCNFGRKRSLSWCSLRRGRDGIRRRC